MSLDEVEANVGVLSCQDQVRENEQCLSPDLDVRGVCQHVDFIDQLLLVQESGDLALRSGRDVRKTPHAFLHQLQLLIYHHHFVEGLQTLVENEKIDVLLCVRSQNIADGSERRGVLLNKV